MLVVDNSCRRFVLDNNALRPEQLPLYISTYVACCRLFAHVRAESTLACACRDNALACLNELVTDALALVPECLAYMRQIKNPEVFRFCAIPQVRASTRGMVVCSVFSTI